MIIHKGNHIYRYKNLKTIINIVYPIGLTELSILIIFLLSCFKTRVVFLLISFYYQPFLLTTFYFEYFWEYDYSQYL